MSKFEWMELETLSTEIAHSQSRLDAARATGNQGLVNILQQEIAGATERRARVIAEITRGVDVVGSTRPKVKRFQPERSDVKEQPTVEVETSIATEVAALELTPINTTEGAATVWDKLTPADVERARQGLAGRRAELLTRHAEELKALDTEQTEIDAFERAIGAFATKFKIGGGGEVVPLNPERSMQAKAG